MIQVTIPGGELFDSKTNEFVNFKTTTVSLEHSLISISKWEAKWKKPFFKNEERSLDEIVDYIACMSLNPNIDHRIFHKISSAEVRRVSDYISDPMTATTFNELEDFKNNKQIVTSELIYYWMIAYNIPFECQKWHINRLLTLIRICGIKNAPPKKTSKAEMMRKRAQINAERRSKLHTKG